MATAKDFHKEGYNCCEAMLKSANVNKGLDIPVNLGSPFGSGMTVGSTCGAITGAAMILGHLKGRKDSTEKNLSWKDTKALMNAVKEKYGTLECIQLKKQGVSCNEIIEYVEELLNNQL